MLFKTLKPNPGWRLQVETLFCINNLAISRMLGRLSFFPVQRAKKCTQCLRDLVNAIRRQRSHLDEVGSLPATKIAVLEDFERTVCERCGHPFGSVPDTGPTMSV